MQSQFSAIFSFHPYGFQIAVAERLLAGRNVILQAPTGAGKTNAALFPYLLARQEGRDFPRRMIYAVPMRVLAKCFYDDLTAKHPEDKQWAKLQTGEQQDDRRLEGRAIFATIDQVLSSFLNIPYSLSQRQANLNAGAVISSYLVFDEFHLFDPGSTLPTVLEMLKRLNGVAPFLLMTATFSQTMLKQLAEVLNADEVMVRKEELADIPAQCDKERRFHVATETLTPATVLAHHKTRSIAICNTVERAQELWQGLRRQLAATNTRVILLHSRFLPEDRKQKESDIRRWFGPLDNAGTDRSGSVILVATQVIEVGLDITCQVMHTEVAPANSILQRAGRCARFAGEEERKGDVYIYPVPLDQTGKPNYHPYTEDGGSDRCEATLSAFQDSQYRDQVLDFTGEQRLIDRVHRESDRQMLATLHDKRTQTWSKMVQAISQQDRGMAKELIRENDSRTILVGDPAKITDPFGYEGFSLFRGSLYKHYKALTELAPTVGVDWVMQYPQQEDKGEDEREPARYTWLPVTSEKMLSCSPLFMVHPRLVCYDEEGGFRFQPGDGQFSSPEKKRPETAGPFESRYRLETYLQHVQGMKRVYDRALRDELAFAAARMEKTFGLPPQYIERAIRLAIALHDVGKLSVRWQDWAHRWQAAIGEPQGGERMLAHTHYESATQAALNQKMSRDRPNHAAESAVASAYLVRNILLDPRLIKATLTAIARHHSPQVNDYGKFSLHPVAQVAVAEALNDVATDGSWASHAQALLPGRPYDGKLDTLSIRFDQPNELLIYLLLVRALRLCDQGSQKEG
jgi:CRISPR-associated endonuclease/helicase Cas3